MNGKGALRAHAQCTPKSVNIYLESIFKYAVIFYIGFQKQKL